MGLNNKKRGRPGIKDSIELLIVDYAVNKYPDMERIDLASLIIRELEAIGEKTPAEDTLVKKISKARNPEEDFLDTPWTLDKTLDLPHDAIAAIFEVQKWLEDVKDKPSTRNPTSGIKEWTENLTNGEMSTNIWPLTIREAQWIARLHKVKIEFYGLPGNTYYLWYLAKSYADYQRLCKIAGIEFNTTILDEGIRKENIGEAKRKIFENYKDGE